MNKKAVSEIVSYTLLIVIAIGVSSLVYYFLQLQTPKEKTECKEGISLTINTLSCDKEDQRITISLLNNGRFKVNAAYIRIGKPSDTVRIWINNPQTPGVGDENFYISDSYALLGLLPGKISATKQYSASSVITNDEENYIIEVEPAVVSESTGKLASCENAIITQKVICS